VFYDSNDIGVMLCYFWCCWRML